MVIGFLQIPVMFCRSGLKAFFTAILIAPTFALKPLKTSVVQLGDISYYLKEKVDVRTTS